MASVLPFCRHPLSLLLITTPLFVACDPQSHEDQLSSPSNVDSIAKLETPACDRPADLSPVRLDGGEFLMGSDDAYPEEGPARTVSVDPFWMDRTEVTTGEFETFVEATGYQTVAERPINPEDFPGVDPDLLKPGSAVFTKPKTSRLRSFLDWWSYIQGADWRYPQGLNKPAAKTEDPVTQIAFEDALAYAEWVGGRLPTEAEWEFAARAGDIDAPTNSKTAPANANTWQGLFPYSNSQEDGFVGIAPAACYAPNDYGFYDMIGNVWEWTADWYAPTPAIDQIDNPTGVSELDSYDPANPGVPSRVLKGGSYLCADNYCLRYRPSARHAQDTGLGTNHIGFRLAYDQPPDVMTP